MPNPAKDVAENVRDGESMLRRTPFALENWSVRRDRLPQEFKHGSPLGSTRTG
jgi:hypothetical protein